MDKSQIFYGALVTLIADVILLLSSIGSEIIIGGLAAALFIIFIIINRLRLSCFVAHGFLLLFNSTPFLFIKQVQKNLRV